MTPTRQNGYLLKKREVEKVWGQTNLPARFQTSSGSKIGEIWFEPTQDCPDILVKYLFTSQKLSVQVHPKDSQAPQGHSGKEECWYILDAEPGASLAIGPINSVSKSDLRQAARDGSIEQLLEWHNVSSGDFFYLPAGTIHAIGPGINLLEVQQNSDITYRLYDYGRPRELHLDEALNIAQREPYDSANHRRRAIKGSSNLVAGPHFRMDMIKAGDTSGLQEFTDGALIVPLEGITRIGALKVGAGQCGWAPSFNDVDLTESLFTMVINK